ncbi:MAG: thiamine phosphate synthase [Pseudomonadales bacterium]|nr:thiamine phosphate synthase [Pseudomonadales bacterium]
MIIERSSCQWRGIYAITDDVPLPLQALLDQAQAALDGGVTLFQFRSKSLTAQEREDRATALLERCRDAEIPLLINDDVELCAKIQAAGVHLGKSDTSLTQARELLGSQAIIGITCHDSISRARKAESEGADYVAFGRFFPSQTKPDASPAPVELLKEAKSALSTPIVAIGGINAENGASLINAGADMLAVIHGLFGTGNVYENARALSELFQ